MCLTHGSENSQQLKQNLHFRKQESIPSMTYSCLPSSSTSSQSNCSRASAHRLSSSAMSGPLCPRVERGPGSGVTRTRSSCVRSGADSTRVLGRSGIGLCGHLGGDRSVKTTGAGFPIRTGVHGPTGSLRTSCTRAPLLLMMRSMFRSSTSSTRRQRLPGLRDFGRWPWSGRSSRRTSSATHPVPASSRS